MRRLDRIRALAVGGAAVALLGVAAGGAFAASNPATLYACYDVDGNVRMGDSAQCKLPGGGRLVSWGDAGDPGTDGRHRRDRGDWSHRAHRPDGRVGPVTGRVRRVPVLRPTDQQPGRRPPHLRR